MTLVKGGKVDVIPDPRDRREDDCDGILQWGRGERWGSTLNTASASENGSSRSRRGGICGWKITERNHQRKGGFWLNQPSRILAEGRPGGWWKTGGLIRDAE